MNGDFSRDTFDPANHFSRVLMQQGRVQLDSDWNEQTSILLHYLRTLARDVFGTAGGPAQNAGFKILTAATADLEQTLAAWEPTNAGRRDELLAAVKEGDLVIGPGRYYVRGWLVENERAVLYSKQRGYPFDERTTLDSLESWQGAMLVYLDVWEQFVTSVEYPSIRDVALNGVDTCGRARVTWAVRALLQERGQAALDCSAANELPSLGTGRLRASVQPDRAAPDPYLIRPESLYPGMENRLYRVEVHRGGEAVPAGGGATFKWSRENASVIVPLVRLTGNKAKVVSLGRDQRLGLQVGNWVEVLDDTLAARSEAGPLARVDDIESEELTVTLTWAANPGGRPPPSYSAADAEKHPLLRRWDQAGDLTEHGGALPITEADPNQLSEGWIALEDGIRIRFERCGPSRYRTGDYWLIPARVASGDIDWPLDPAVTQNPVGLARPAHGTWHFHAPLYLRPDQGDTTDCRCRIDKLPCLGP
jgi:hypothetical protein